MKTTLQDIVHSDPPNKPFETMVRYFFRKPTAIDTPQPVQQPVQMKVEVKEDAKAYTVRAEIPGLNKEDIKVSVEGNQVSIGIEGRVEKEATTGENVVRDERHYRGLHRRLTLTHAIVQADAQAKYTDGVLEIVLPKSAAVRSKLITVQ